MTHDMSEFWEPQPRIVTPADMDRAVPPPSDAVVLLGLDADDTPGRQHLQAVGPAGQRLPETGQMEHLRHHLHGAPVQRRRHAALARADHRAAQRRADPEQHADPRHDGIHRLPENGRPRPRPDRAAGPPEPGPLPQYLDQGTVRRNAGARIPAGHSGDSRFGILAIHGMETFSP